jgi:hypothetical protein
LLLRAVVGFTILNLDAATLALLVIGSENSMIAQPLLIALGQHFRPIARIDARSYRTITGFIMRMSWGGAQSAKLISKDEIRCIAANIAKVASWATCDARHSPNAAHKVS